MYNNDDDFTTGVRDGLRLAKRIYYGNDRSVVAPKPVTPMEKATKSLYPTSPMVYAVIYNPAIVDNPDMPSYQPHVHGRCDPPALIPLQMNDISFEVECYLDTAFVTMSGSWRVHCVMGDADCSCRVAIPMGEEGSILGAEVEVARKSYSTKLVVDENGEEESAAVVEDGGLLKPQIFTLTIPQVDGGSNLSVKVRWTQKVIYKDGEFILNVPYSFPEYVTPASKKHPKKERIQLKVNCGLTTDIACKTTSHPLKERKREPGKLDLLYETLVLTWSSTDFIFKYHAFTTNLFGSVLLKSPSPQSIDQRDMFSLYLFAYPDKRRKVFRKEAVFIVDISESMQGNTIELTKNALIAALSKLEPDDFFGIMAFNDQTHLYSSTLELATNESLKKANEWIDMNFIASGGTNMSIALDQALELFSGTSKSIPMVFFITDGATENERQICEVMQKQQKNKGSELFPRIHTFGIGSFCNHYFLRMLAMMSKGHYDASYDADSIETQMQMWASKASSLIMTNIVIDGPDDLEIYPSTIPDLCYNRPLIISGRYKGKFPEKLEAKGTIADMSNFTIDIEVQHTNDIPLEKMLAKNQIESYTTQAWFSEDKELEQKVAKISLETGTVSEYTHMIMLKTEPHYKPSKSGKTGKKQGKKKPDQEGLKTEKIYTLHHLGLGFGNMVATFENIPPRFVRAPSQTDKIVSATGNCCADVFSKCCCMCCIQACSRINNQCSVVLTQTCGFLTCSACCE
ncbi:putative von Willebrand factor, type A, von Willebrand factor A-like domain superfamily [Helianthus annuus]|nr:putative von Willebrand factor, type A, von Willebrand factor A-like domain superfamily [Helianthus annuus]